jgi:N-acetylmuramic acid 6-phosphate etherase
MARDQRKIFDELRQLTTEQRNPATARIDLASPQEILSLLNEQDRSVADVVQGAIPSIAQAVGLVVESFRRGGRLLYFGAGTSGRLGVIDAAECPPTFGTPPEMVVGVIAGGRDTVFLSREGVEDLESSGEADVDTNGVSDKDTVVGITASRRTPYVIGALKRARELGASTIFLTCNPRAHADVDVEINVVVGPEAVTGSTRMKAGTAQKMVLNMLTTASMIRLGKVYENLMVDLKPTSVKLQERAKGIISILAGVDYDEAGDLYETSGRNVKVAVVMARSGADRAAAERALEVADGFLARALEERA